MPCQSDYLAQSGQELESKRVSRLIIYLCDATHTESPGWVRSANDEYYGNVQRLDEATKMLCEMCRSLTICEGERLFYDAHSKQARELASWWERHQEWDKRRVAEEDAAKAKIHARERALSKLTTEDMKALGL